MPGGSTLPGGSGESGTGGDLGEGDSDSDADPSWEIPEEGGADGGWQTSNEIPESSSEGGSGSAGEPGAEGGAAGAGGATEAGGDPSGGTLSGTEAELEGALKDFDGEILAEREIISNSPGSGGSTEIATEDDGGGSGAGGIDGESQVGGALPKRAIPPTPAPPRRGAEGIPDDIPDAKDDDIIARQLREAAMQEEDPVLKEKLWEEYRKYKKG